MNLKQKDIKPCILCGRPPLHENVPVAYHISLTVLGLDLNAVRRQIGLEMVLGGSAALALAMGPDEDLLKSFSEPVKGLVCVDCVKKSIAELLEVESSGG